MDLFEHHRLSVVEAEAPLAARMRPRSLDEFVGQGAIVGPGRLLRRAIQADQLSSLIFYGPPGTGKTTLARIIANTTQAHFIAINAVLSGVKEIREAIATAQDQRGLYNQRTILFVDEVHRFNKAQQDALLPWVENGTVILIGATTENPFFEVNKALVSRSRLFQLKPLDEDDLRQIAQQALTDTERGYGQLTVQIQPDALNHLVNVANGDARSLLNALELAVETTPPRCSGSHYHYSIRGRRVDSAAGLVLYDKEGDAHFDIISAFIKSLRGSDPDAALYWLARMIYAGEDPRFIFRRMLILAGEDVGLADPNAIVVVNACAAAFDRVGMPEGRYPLAQATLYLATAPKSNSVMGFFDALAAVEREREAEVPSPMKDASRDQQGFGHGAGYLYPHAYRDHWVAQQYLPSSLQGQVFYQPSPQGYEDTIRVQVARQREAQLTALVEGTAAALPEVLSFSLINPGQDRWLQRTVSQTGERLTTLRDRLFALTNLQRHYVVLDLNAGSGLLTWEALRRVPEGGVYACVHQSTDAAALIEQAQTLPDLLRPIVLSTPLQNLPTLLQEQFPALRFDCLLGRNALMRESEKVTIVQQLLSWLQPEGTIVLAESIPRHTQRLYRLLNPDRLLKLDGLSSQGYAHLIQAEEAIYCQPDDPMVNWDETDLQQVFTTAGCTVELQLEKTTTEQRITAALLDRWFSRTEHSQPTYADHLARSLTPEELIQVQTAFTRLLNQTVAWEGTIALLHAKARMNI